MAFGQIIEKSANQHRFPLFQAFSFPNSFFLREYCCEYRDHSIMHLGGDQTMQMYGNFEGFDFPLIVHCLGW